MKLYNKFLFKNPYFVRLFDNAYHHMEHKNKDFLLVICGDEGVGKSNLMLILYELWNKIRGIKTTKEDIKNIHVERMKWLEGYRGLPPYTMCVNDEGADGLSSKEAVKKFGRSLEKLFKIFRKKKYFTVLCIPDYFDLPPYFRKRLRALIWVNREGKYKFYDKNAILWLNELNQNKHPKSMFVTYPRFTGSFPMYSGVLKKPYEDLAEFSVDNIYEEVIAENTSSVKKKEKITAKQLQVLTLSNEGYNQTQIGKKLDISQAAVNQHLTKAKTFSKE